MIEKSYPVAFEIAGPAAMFSRPDTGSAPISYPAPTQSALKSIFESVVMSKQAYFVPRKVELCLPVVYSRYTTNYGGPLRKSGPSNFQFFATVLENVCYKVYGEILAYYPTTHEINAQHQLQEVFLRRLTSGQFYTTPFLGWKEFTPTYFGPLRSSTQVDRSINLTIPSMLLKMYTRPTEGQVAPIFVSSVQIQKGVLLYAE